MSRFAPAECLLAGRSGADFLGPLLPAVAEICSDLEPLEDVDSSMLKLFRNLWFYIVLFGLAPPIQKVHQQPITYPRSVSSGSQGNLSVMQTVAGPYVWNVEWSTAVNRLTQSTPPLVRCSLFSAIALKIVCFIWTDATYVELLQAFVQ